MTEFFDALWKWINESTVTLLTNFVAYVMVWVITAWLKIKLAGLAFAWGVAQSIMSQLDVSHKLADAFSFIPEKPRAMLMWARVPDALNIIGSGFISKFVLRILGW
jgi:hypothetical protein